jgi:hypothetical protein
MRAKFYFGRTIRQLRLGCGVWWGPSLELRGSKVVGLGMEFLVWHWAIALTYA